MEEPIKRKAGRPKRGEAEPDMRQHLLDAAVEILQSQGAEYVTIRNVCDKAGASVGTYYHYFKNKDDLLAYFVTEPAYGAIHLERPFSDLAGRIFELWSHLLRLYQSLGVSFTRSYYNCDNYATSAYRLIEGDHFQDGTLLERSRRELLQAQREGYLLSAADPLYVAADIGDIIKGCVFEWCLCKGGMPLEDAIRRIVNNYLAAITTKQETLS